MARPRKLDQGLPSRVYLKSGSYYYVHAVGQRWERIGTDLKRAREIAAQYNGAAGARNPNTMAYWLKQWHQELEARVKTGTLAPRTRDDYVADSVPIEAVFGSMAPRDIQAKHITEYLKIGRDEDRPVRANREKAALSSCLSWMVANSHADLRENVAKLVRRNREVPRCRYVSDSEYKRVYELCGPAEMAWMELMYRTLQRPSDILKWTHSAIEQDGARSVLAFRQSKTGAQMRIEITPTLRACITQLAGARSKKSLYLIPREDGKPYTESGISSMFRRAVAKSGIQDLAPYDMKAKGATDLYQAGVPLTQIQALCGHDSVQTTEVYIKQHLRLVLQPNERKIG